MTTPPAEAAEPPQAEMLDGTHLPVDSARVEALGTLDELSAHLGVVRAHAGNAEWTESLLAVQRDLCLVMSEVADPSGAVMTSRLGSARAGELLDEARALPPREPPPAGVPSDPLTRSVFLARDVTLRALRALEGLADQPQPPGEHLLAYLAALLKFLERWPCSPGPAA